MRTFSAVGFVSAVLSPSVPLAGPAEDFLASLSGSFSGKGVAEIVGETRQPIACKITTNWDAANNTLAMKGNCASSQGKDAIGGSVRNNNGKITGTFVAPRANTKVTKSSGTVDGSKLVINASVFDSRVSKLSQIRQVITRNGDGFKAVFYTLNTQTRQYEEVGSINFRRR